MEAMVEKLSKAGCTVEVPCVQEIAKQPLTKVPERFVRPELDLQVVSDTVSSQQEVPIIDMSKLLSPDLHASELHKLDLACKHWGFFQLINHGVSPSLVENVKKGVEDFFNLPMEEKNKFWQKAGEREGFGQLFVVSEEQKLNWGDLFWCITFPREARNPHSFPKIPLPFRDNLDTYCIELRKLAIKMTHLMGEALNMEPKEIAELFEEGSQSINEVEGLQIKKDGKWVPINPLPEAFVINLGDTSEIVSNGTYKSIEHRATVNSKKERMSMATFFAPKLDTVIGPSPNLITPERPALFKRIGMSEYYKGLFSRQLRGKSNIQFMRIHSENDEST